MLACGSRAATARTAPDDAAINRPIIIDQIIPGYRMLATTATALDETARAFCADPSPAGLASARAVFGAVFLAWSDIHHIRFGPAALLMRTCRIQFWPDKRGRAGKQLRALADQLHDVMADGGRASRKTPACEFSARLYQCVKSMFRRKSEIFGMSGRFGRQ